MSIKDQRNPAYEKKAKEAYKWLPLSDYQEKVENIGRSNNEELEEDERTGGRNLVAGSSWKEKEKYWGQREATGYNQK